MMHRAIIKAGILNEQWRICVNHASCLVFLTRQEFHTPILSRICGCRFVSNVREFCSGKRIDHLSNCSHNENISPLPSMVTKNIQEMSQEADRQTIPDDLQTKDRVGVVFGDTVIDGSTGEWLTLSQEVNSYPSLRRFTAIGIGGNDFVQSMILAVESVIQYPVPQSDVKQRVSSGGKYVSVNIGPIRVVSREQVRAIYTAMRSDNRMKFFL